MFRALKHLNFRLFFAGQTVSLVGTWMQIMAVSWLSYRLTSSPFMLGCVAFVAQIPSLFLAPIAGVVSDRYDRRKLLVAVQALSMLQAVILTILVLTHTVNIIHILCLSLFLGVINSFELTLRQSFLVELVDDKVDLPNAIALNALMFNVSRILGPAFAGLLVVSFGEGACFAINACSYAAVMVGLLLIRTNRRIDPSAGMDLWRELKSGWRYAYGFLPIRMLLLVIALFSVVGAAIHTLLPVIVKEVFRAGPGLFGALLTASGVGAIIGTTYLAGKKSIHGFVETIALSALLMSVGVIIFAATAILAIAFVSAFLIGLSMMIGIGAGNMVLQTLVREEKRGRVMSLYAVALLGTAPLGSLSAGIFASKFGAGAALAVASGVTLAGAVLFWRKLKRYHLKARSIYIDKGIIPEI